MKRTYEVDVLRCECGGERRVIACISEPSAVRAILEHLGPWGCGAVGLWSCGAVELWSEPAVSAPSRAPPVLDFG